MTRITLDAHPSVVIAPCEALGKLLMAVYDGTYPQVSYRFSANNIGGNPSPKDGSPRNVLLREIEEEYDSNHKEKTQFGETVLWAPSDDIELIRNQLLQNAIPYGDFYVKATQFPTDPTTKNYSAIFSAFYAKVGKEVIEAAESNLRRCRRLSPEGLTGIFTLDELANDFVKGELSTAHATAPILNHYFDSRIPFPKQLKAEHIGQVRDSFSDYSTEFQYSLKIATAIGLVETEY